MEKRKILNVYATRYGSTRIVAREIESYLEQKGFHVTTWDLKEKGMPRNLSEFEDIVVGSSVAMFMWMGRAKTFLRKLRKQGIIPAVYICCGTAIKEKEKARDKFLIPVLERLGLNSCYGEVIEPVIDFRPTRGLPEKKKKSISGTIKAMAGDQYTSDGLMDFRDPDHFRNFLIGMEESFG